MGVVLSSGLEVDSGKLGCWLGCLNYCVNYLKGCEYCVEWFRIGN